jgi:hypothetical protein
MTRYPKSTPLVLLPFLFGMACMMLFSACLTLDPNDTFIIDAETRIKRSSTVMGDTFNVVYLPPEPIDSNQSPPTVVYTFKFWQPEFFES